MKRGTTKAPSDDSSPPVQVDEEIDVVIVGAGLSGINTAYRLQTEASGFSYTILEMRHTIGGTWDLFKFPGIRSDSDIFTFAYPFHPWTQNGLIAHGADIRNYIEDTAKTYGIDKNIRFKHKVGRVDWSSETARWTVSYTSSVGDVQEQREQKIVCKFLIWCSGYYKYDEALKVELPGIQNFKGTIAHPQFWPTDLDYTNRRVLIVGSGATAVTMLPVVAEKAGHVTMLQRSPGYFLALPVSDSLADLVKRWLPEDVAHQINRFKYAALTYLIMKFFYTFPNVSRRFFRWSVSRQLPPAISPDTFVPKYNPGEQRICQTVDGDFFAALRAGNADVVTAQIDTFTEAGIKLKDGKILETDIVVTATGLKMQFAGGAEIYVDGERIEMGKKYMWKCIMIDSLPNMAYILGYSDAAWTLGSDVSAKCVCRLLNQLRKKKCDFVVAHLKEDEKMEPAPLFNLTSTYMKSGLDSFPKSSNSKPWIGHTNFFADYYHALLRHTCDYLHYESLSGKSEDVELENAKLL